MRSGCHFHMAPFRELHESRWPHLQPDREAQHRSDRGIEFASLDRSDIVAMQPGGVAERFLAEATTQFSAAPGAILVPPS